MNESKYKKMNDYMAESKSRSSTIKALHDILPVIMMFFYPVQLLYLLFTTGFKNEVFLKATFIPLLVLVLVTAMRYLVNAKRPYEVYSYSPVVPKKTKGKSFPSRHTASAFIIAMAFLYIDVKVGVVMMVLAFLIGITRIVSGVHFVRDVIGGALISIIIGLVGFFLI